MIPYGRQEITAEDIEAVTEVLKSPFLTQGPAVPKFEADLCHVSGAKHAIAVNSATSALHIAYLALELGQGDILWTSPNTFVATSNAALYCGAAVDFVDIDPDTYNLSIDALADKLENASKLGKLPKIVTVVHFAGQSADMSAIRALSEKYGFRVVEDASHAVGGSYNDLPVGSCSYSDISVFSFHPVKIVTTAEGGAATTNDDGLARQLQLFRSHGVTRDPELLTTHNPDPWYYEQHELGWNYRLTDIQAALGSIQLSRLKPYVARRHEILKQYTERLGDLPLKLPYQESFQKSAVHLFPIQLLDADRRTVFSALRDAGIGVNVHYIPVHTQPYYSKLGFKQGDFPNAEEYYSRAISLPMFPALTDEDFDHVCNTLKRVLWTSLAHV